MFVESGPLPPHERSWRHPSELAAEERAAAAAQPAPTMTRRLVIGSGILGLIAVGVLIVAASPHVMVATQQAVSTSMPLGAQRASGAIGIASHDGAAGPQPANAVPVGDGRLAVGSRAAIEGAAGDRDAIQVALPDGSLARARVIVIGDDAAVVQLDRVAEGIPISARDPHATETVSLLVTPTTQVAYAQIVATSDEIVDGTPILDAQGQLVAICGVSDDGVSIIRVRDEYETATNANR